MPVPELHPVIAWNPVRLYDASHQPVFSDLPIAFPFLLTASGILSLLPLFSVLRSYADLQKVFLSRAAVFFEHSIRSPLLYFLIPVPCEEIRFLFDAIVLIFLHCLCCFLRAAEAWFQNRKKCSCAGFLRFVFPFASANP